MMIGKKQRDKVVRSAHMRKKNSKPHTTEIRSRTWLFGIMLVVFILVLGYVFLCSYLVNITQIEVQGTQRVLREHVIAAVQEVTAGRIMECIPQNNYFFISHVRIMDRIREDQRIKNVLIQKQFPDKIIIAIEEYDVLPVWCVKDVDNACYELVDGCAIRQVDLASDLIQQNTHFIVVDRGREQMEIGQCVVSVEDLDTIAFLGNELIYALNVGIVQPYIIDVRGSHEVRYGTDESWDILVSLIQDPQETINMAKTFTTKISLPIERKDLGYVDLRFSEKIFYKPKDGVEIVAELSQEQNEQDAQGDEDDEKINDAHD